MIPMTSIIAQVAEKVVEEIIKNIERKGISEIGRTAEELLGTLKAGALTLLSATIEEVDHAILDAKAERRADGLSVKTRNVERTCITGLGELKFRRTYYQCKDGTKVYLTDHLIGIEPFERVSRSLCAKLVENAASMSMKKAAEVEQIPVSRQTVNNKVLSMKETVTEIRRAENTPTELHLFADEDHVSLRPKGNAIVPLVTVTEGIDQTDRSRHKTIHPLHFQGYGMTNDAFVETIVAAIYERYDMENVRAVYIHADGGNWIRKLGALLPQSVYVMDGFHLEKYSKALFRLNGAAHYAGVLRQAIARDDFESFARFCASIRKNQTGDSLAKMEKLVNYFQNNWDSIVKRLRGGLCGSCTEPLVSHILSERLSRNPLAWSREGLAKMAMLRVFTQNGGVVSPDHIRISRSVADRSQDFSSLRFGFSLYKQYAEKQAQISLGGHHDWSIFEKDHVLPGLTDGKYSGLSILLNAYSHFHNSF